MSFENSKEFQQMVLSQLDTHVQRMKLNAYFIFYMSEICQNEW